jgi:hypothetical protein
MRTGKQGLRRVTRRDMLKTLGPIAIVSDAVAASARSSSLLGEPESATPLTKNVPAKSGDLANGVPLNCQQFAFFRALENHAPLAAYASMTKAVVNSDGSVQQVLYPKELGYGKERVDGPRLILTLLFHASDVAQVTQRYTNADVPTVETKFAWPDAELAVSAFAADPEGQGFYVRADLVNRCEGRKEFGLEVSLENAGALRAEDPGLLDSQGNVVLAVTHATDGTNSASWEAVHTPRVGLRFVALLDALEQKAFAFEMPLEGKASSQSFVTTQKTTAVAWQRHMKGGLRLEVPCERLQEAWEVNLKQVGMLLELRADGLRILKGLNRYHGSNPYDTFQASLILDRLGHHDKAEALLRRQLKKIRSDGIFEMWERSVPPSGNVDQWIVQGLVPFAMWKHYEMLHDQRWLHEIWPIVFRSVEATRDARRSPAASGKQGKVEIHGFVPPGFGDGGIPNGYTLPQNFGPLAGMWVALQIARILNFPEKRWLQQEYDNYRNAILQVMRASTVKASTFTVVPSYPGADSEEAFEHLWGTVEGVYPFEQISYDDPLVVGTLRYLESQKSCGLHLHLGYSAGVWPYMSASLAHWHLHLGEYDAAYQILQAIMNHASPTWGWYEEIDHNPVKGFGDIPDIWASCELLNTTREILLLEKDRTLLLGMGIPDSWTRQEGKVVVEGAPTVLSRCSFRIQWTGRSAAAHINLADASRVDAINLRLLPEGIVHPRIDSQGAAIRPAGGAVVLLTDLSGEIDVKASW